MKPTEILTEEHQAIKRMLRVAQKVADKLDRGERVDPEDLKKIVDFIRTFADRCHHAKEEDLLFPAMEKHGIPREGGPIGVMLLEHDQGRSFVKAMLDSIPAYREGDQEAGKSYARNARQYLGLLDQHIDKEDNILYMMADMHIPEPEQEALLERFKRAEREAVGEGVHERFLELLEGLEAKYL